MQSLELVKSSELIMVFRISKIHTNADFTFSNNTCNKNKEFWLKCTMYYCILTTGKLKLLRKDNIHEEGIDL